MSVSETRAPMMGSTRYSPFRHFCPNRSPVSRPSYCVPYYSPYLVISVTKQLVKCFMIRILNIQSAIFVETAKTPRRVCKIGKSRHVFFINKLEYISAALFLKWWSPYFLIAYQYSSLSDRKLRVTGDIHMYDGPGSGLHIFPDYKHYVSLFD